jgi:hypothetical protein
VASGPIEDGDHQFAQRKRLMTNPRSAFPPSSTIQNGFFVIAIISLAGSKPYLVRMPPLGKVRRQVSRVRQFCEDEEFFLCLLSTSDILWNIIFIEYILRDTVLYYR